MDRLSFIAGTSVLLCLAAFGCSRDDNHSSPGMSRVAAVKATEPVTSADRWCDVFRAVEKASDLTLPPVDAAHPGDKIRPLPKDRWVLLNLWATWCGPCLREIPLIQKWMKALNREGVRIELWFLSIDESADDVKKFFQTNPLIARSNSVRLTEMSALKPWMQSFGLKPQTAIPVNILASPGLKVRCIRTGSISDSHFPILRNFLKNH